MHILIADDDQNILGLLTNWFGAMGHEVVQVEDGQQAWLAVQNRQKDFDLILLDLQMPQMDGLKVLQMLREGGNETPAAMISGRADSAMIVGALRLRAFDFLVKPFNQDQISELLQRFEILRNVDVGVSLSESAGIVYQERLELKFNSKTAVIKTVVRRIVDHLRPFLTAASTKTDVVTLALMESVTNAVIHGNLQVSGELREHDWNGFWAEIHKREALEHYAARQVTVSVDFGSHGIGLTVSDQGAGFDFTNLADPVDPVAMSSGRGLTLIRYSMDNVYWEDNGSTIKMFKKLA